MDAITKLSDLDKLEFNLTQLELFRNDHGRDTLTTLVNGLMIDEIQYRMRGFGYSRKIIERTFLERIEFLPTGEAEIHIKSDYFSESGFSVSDAREKGTVRHKIEPKSKDGGVLSFFINGQRVYSKGHFVEGIAASHIIENTIQQNTSKVQLEFQRIESQWVSQSLEK